MIIRKLKIENLRNLESVELQAHASLNYLCGDNGAGKTSVLEAIAVLSRGRSFRTTQASELAGPCDQSYRVFAETLDENQSTNRLGLERHGTHWHGRVNGQDVRQLSELSRLLPVVLMVPDSHQLVSGPPENRRKYIDWGLFHVKHGFLDRWRRFSKALKQRNAALRTGRLEFLESLDEVLAESGTRLDEQRRYYVDSISERIPAVLADLKSRVGEMEFHYNKGWKTDSYLESLIERRDRDIERCTTGSGPHRAELNIVCRGVVARSVLSRGEQKALAAALLLTQAEVLREAGVHPVLLLDDLVSEFDQEHFESVLDKSLQTGAQTWVTGTTNPGLNSAHKLFHVEQGALRELL